MTRHMLLYSLLLHLFATRHLPPSIIAYSIFEVIERRDCVQQCGVLRLCVDATETDKNHCLTLLFPTVCIEITGDFVRDPDSLVEQPPSKVQSYDEQPPTTSQVV
jgi:hypothetical protein